MEEGLSENLDWNEQWNFKVSGAPILFIFIISIIFLKFQYSNFSESFEYVLQVLLSPEMYPFGGLAS